MKVSVFIRKKRDEANSVEEIFNLLRKYFGDEVTFYELPFGSSSILNIVKNCIFARKHRGDINHISGEVHYLALGTGRNTIVTVHDVGSILTGNAISRRIKKLLFFSLPLRIAKRITVISAFTRDELIHLCPFAKKKISIIHNPISLQNDAPVISKKADEKVILHLGTKPNKNLEGVLQALAGMEGIRLVVLGRMDESQKQLAQKLDITYENQFNLDYKDVLSLYRSSDLVTFPSFYEGFGMPVLEANMTGVPILAGDIDVLREVANDAALFVDPHSVEAIKDGIVKLLNDNKLRCELIEKGKVNIRRFTPESISRQYKDLYAQL